MGRSIFALVLIALAVGLFFFYTKPTYDSVDALQTDITQYNEALDKATQLLQKKQQLVSEFNAFSSTDLDRLQKLLPDHVDNVGLILEIDSLASRYGMSLENIDVSASDSSSSSDSSGSSSSSGSSGDTPTTIAADTVQTYGTMSLKFSTRSSYENFKQFLGALEQSLRIVDITSLQITPDNSTDSTTANASPSGSANASPNASSSGGQSSANNGGAQPDMYRFDVVLRTYWLKS